MIAVGIPTFNEADNIVHLVQQVDAAAVALGASVTIVNADNSSLDGTAEVFRSVLTANQKVSLLTTDRGKGNNVRRILDYVVGHDIPYCFFVDGDVLSWQPNWLSNHLAQAMRGADYVVPNYARNLQEGNATNHIFFPVLNYFTQGRSPFQPIAGDIGISLKLAKHLTTLAWHRATMGYGVDIFISMHALFGGFKVVEIGLERKVHKPSFGKMTTIAEEEATSYYEARHVVRNRRAVHFTREVDKPAALLSGNPLPTEEVAGLIKHAISLIETRADSLLYRRPILRHSHRGIDSETWADVMLAHEKQVGLVDAPTIARSLTPFYLLRATEYLLEALTPTKAQEVLSHQTSLIGAYYAAAGL